jgi:hypothetical protein
LQDLENLVLLPSGISPYMITEDAGPNLMTTLKQLRDRQKPQFGLAARSREIHLYIAQ